MIEMESRLGQAHKMAALGILTGGIAHDFKNILSPITMYAGMASMGIPARDPLHSHMEKILKAADRAIELVDQLTTFSRYRDPEPRPLMLTPVIKETVKLMRYSVPSTVRISQKLDVASDKILADPVRVHQVLVNLIVNTVQQMGEDGGVVTVGLTDRGNDSARFKSHPGLSPESVYLKLTVSHGECEIRSETSPFEPYDTAKRKRDGIGPGLELVNEWVKELKGGLFLNCAREKGSAFEIFLPKVEIDQAEKPDTRQTPAAGRGRILFVDDDLMVVEAAEVMLLSLGYEVTKAAGGLEALATFKKTPEGFDLIITDQMMSDMMGDDLCREFLRIRPDIPIILCTGYDEMMNEKLAEEAGSKAFFSKPIKIGELAGTIKRLLDQSRNAFQPGPRPSDRESDKKWPTSS